MKPRLFFFAITAALGISLAALVGGFGWGSQFLGREATGLRNTLSDSQIRDERISQLHRLQTDYEKFRVYEDRINAALPKGKHQSELVLQMKQMVTAAGMNFPGIDFPVTTKPGASSQTVKTSSGLAIPLSFDLVGSYGQMQRFLQNLELYSRTTDVTSVVIHRESATELRFSVNMNVQVLP